MKCDPKITNKAAENRQSMQALLGHVELKGIRVPQSAMLVEADMYKLVQSSCIPKHRQSHGPRASCF